MYKRQVTIEYLTIENYWQPEGQNVVNSDAGVGWTIEHDTIGPNNPCLLYTSRCV